MKVKALVVENNPVLLRAVSKLLEQQNCQVKTASNGLEALDIIYDYQPDILFTDLIMPLVGGEKLCRIVRKSEQLKDVFIVVLSAILLEDKERIEAEVEYDLCIVKGDIAELKGHLQNALALFSSKTNDAKRILGAAEVPEKSKEGLSVIGELLHEDNHIRKILENLNEGIVELNGSGMIITVNQSAADMLGCGMEQLIGREVDASFWGRHREIIHQWMQDELVGRGFQTLEISEFDPIETNGRVVSAYFLPVREKDSTFAICILRDITRQHRAEQRKRELDDAMRLVKKMDAMSCMAGGVAHDFNNLLSAVCGNLEMVNISGSRKDIEESIQFVENARQAAYLAVDLIRKISCFSPFGIVKREDVIFEEFIEKKSSEFFTNKSIGFTFNKETGPHWVSIDPEQIGSAIEEVFQNAIDAGSTKKILVSVTEESFDMQMVKARQYIPDGRYVRLLVRDFGRGIKKEDLLKIFDPYYSTKQRGTAKGMGLGLTIVYSTLRNHGGYVIVESEPGRGTDVSFLLPTHQIRQDVGKKSDTRKRTVLFIEHDEQLGAIGKIMLEYLGYRAAVAPGKKEAVDEARKGISGGDPFNAAIVNLPESGGSDAVEIRRLLHDIDPGLQVVVSSGALLDPVIKNYKDFGFSHVLCKPYTLDDLKRVLSEM